MVTRIRRGLKRTESECIRKQQRRLRAPLFVVVSQGCCMESRVKAALPRSSIYTLHTGGSQHRVGLQ